MTKPYLHYNPIGLPAIVIVESYKELEKPKNSKTHVSQSLSITLVQFLSSSVFVALFISGYFYISPYLVAVSLCLNLAKIL